MPKGKKHRRSESKELRQLKEKIIKSKNLTEEQIVLNTNSRNKMSEALHKFIEPFSALARDQDTYKSVVNIAVLVWNATVSDTETRQQMLTEFERSWANKDKRTQKIAAGLVKDMIRRKDRHFSQDKRYILDFTVSVTRDGYHLAVVAASPKEEPRL